MALLERVKNFSVYLSYPRAKAAFGLLSDNSKKRWLHTLSPKKISQIAMADCYPWYAFSAIDYLERHLRSGMTVLEYGSGYSTLWWAKRVSHVKSLERNPQWCQEVKGALQVHAFDHVELIVVQDIDRHNPQHADRYIAYAEPLQQYDVVIVDDIFRNEVSAAAVDLVKPGGLLILDDSEREQYNQAMRMLEAKKWSFASFYGTPPYHFHEKQTTVWHKPQ